jgi:hypothetical protein
MPSPSIIKLSTNDMPHISFMAEPHQMTCQNERRKGNVFVKAKSAAPLKSHPPINPPRSQTTGDAFSPSPFQMFELHQSSSSCSAGEDENWTPREPAMPEVWMRPLIVVLP